jgi:hypothetical protein
MKNLLIENEIKHLGKAFKKKGIEPILLKGFALIEQAYQKKSLRPMGDIDLMADAGDFEKIESVLKEEGYAQRIPRGLTESYQEKVWRSKDFSGSLMHGFDFYNSQKGTKVDLQWAFHPKRHRLSVDQKEWIEKSTFNERLCVKLLSPEHQLMQLLLHCLVMHSFDYRLYMVLDLALLIERQNIDWKEFKRLSIEMNAEKYVYFAGMLINKFYGKTFPQNVLEELMPSTFNRKIYHLLAENFFSFGRLPQYIRDYPLAFLRNKVFRTVPFSIPF